jgi:hypothetical protein
MKNEYKAKPYDPPEYTANTAYTISVLKEEVFRLKKTKENLENSLHEDEVVITNIDAIDKKIIELNNNINFINEYR